MTETLPLQVLDNTTGLTVQVGGGVDIAAVTLS